jgi:hypothetical protein
VTVTRATRLLAQPQPNCNFNFNVQNGHASIRNQLRASHSLARAYRAAAAAGALPARAVLFARLDCQVQC